MRCFCRFLAAMGWVTAARCQPPGPPCKYGDVDFSALDLPTGHAVKVPQGTLHLNPCTSVSQCSTVPDPTSSSCCLLTNFSRTPNIVSCGAANTHKWTTNLDDPNLQIGMIQTGGSKCGYVLEPAARMQVSISFECDEKEPDPGKLAYVDGGGLYCNLNLTWRTKSACKLPKPELPSYLANNWGMHFLLIFMAVVATYFGLGTLIKSKLPNHSDACYNNIPQRDFWFDLPSLVGDGVVYAASMGSRKANKQGTYESIDSDNYGSADDSNMGESQAEPKE